LFSVTRLTAQLRPFCVAIHRCETESIEADDRSFVDLNQRQKRCRYDGHGACRVVALGTDVSDLIGPGQWEMHHENQRSPEDGS
jgi:hypothetical protein